jgi:hypothetical protein
MGYGTLNRPHGDLVGVAPSKPPTAPLPVPIKSKQALAVKQALSGPDAGSMTFTLPPGSVQRVEREDLGPRGNLTQAEMDAAKPAPREGSITGVKTEFGEPWEITSASPFKALTSKPGLSKKVDLTPPPPVAKVAAALPAPPAAPPDAPWADIPEVVEAAQADLTPDDLMLTPDEIAEEAYNIDQQQAWEATLGVEAGIDVSKLAEGEDPGALFAGPKAPFAALKGFLGEVETGNYAQATKSALEAVLPTDPVGLGLLGAGVALQLSVGADPKDIAINMAKKKAARYAAEQTTNYIANQITEELVEEIGGEVVSATSGLATQQLPGAIAGAPGAIIGAIAAMAATDQPINTESVVNTAGEMGMSYAISAIASELLGSAIGGPAGAVVGLARMAVEINDMKKSALKAKRKYEDQAFSAPITGLQPNLRNIEQSTGHVSRDIQNLFKESWAGENNYLGQQLAKELDPPDGARYYHGDESVRKMMENNFRWRRKILQHNWSRASRMGARSNRL